MHHTKVVTRKSFKQVRHRLDQKAIIIHSGNSAKPIDELRAEIVNRNPLNYAVIHDPDYQDHSHDAAGECSVWFTLQIEDSSSPIGWSIIAYPCPIMLDK